jgi:site-specific DNA recombinase
MMAQKSKIACMAFCDKNLFFPESVIIYVLEKDLNMASFITLLVTGAFRNERSDFFMKKYIATKYLRISYTDDKTDESNSVANQRKLIDDFLKRNPDIEIASEKIDDGYSGVLFDRPAFQEMMQDIAEGKINCVIVKDLSRLGREYIETGRYLRRIFPAYGVRFIAINDNIDTLNENSNDELTVSVKNIMNEAYARDISVKTRSALDVKRRNGDFVGAFTVYGYIRSEENRNRLEVDPYAANIVRDIFRLCMEGASALHIADTLNSTGILSPLAYKRNKGMPCAKGGFADKDDCKWSATTIIRMLQDETYTGTLVQGKQTTHNFKLKELLDKPASEWVRTEDAHEAIISRHDFNLVQRIRHLDTRTSPGQRNVHLFSGMLICGCCGSRMTRKTNRVNGRAYHYYYCPRGKKNGCHAPTMVKESDLVECVRDSLKAYIGNVVSLDALLASVDQQSVNRALTQEYTGQITENEKQLAFVQGFKAKLYENMINGILTKEEYLSFKNKYDSDIARLQEGIALLKKKFDDVLDNRSERNRWMMHFKRFSTLQELDRKAVIQLIQSISIVGKHDLEITFNYQDEYKKALALLAMPEEERQVV